MRTYLFLLVLLLSGTVLQAATIDLFTDRVFQGGNETSLPILVNGADPNSRLRFTVPSSNLLLSVNAARVWITLFDDDPLDASNERGNVILGRANPTPNLFLRDFNPSRVDGYTSSAPNEIHYDFTSAELPDLFDEIVNNGRFSIRVERTAGDYYVAGGRVRLDVTAAPEPATFVTLGIALAGCFAFARRRRRV